MYQRRPCPSRSYTTSYLSGCTDRMCGPRPCTKCPTGVECSSGIEDPWKHFVPKSLKLGSRMIDRAIIKGVTSGFDIDPFQSYEIQYDNNTGDARVAPVRADVASDYVWELAVECTDENQPCEPDQVPTFVLRHCPNGTQLINYTFGSYDFQAQAQQCAPCGPLKYIVDPVSGGSCQDCPKGADCPDGDQFLPKAVGSEWEVHYFGPRSLDAVYRLKTCPPGYFMTRKDKYPLEDECTICEAGTYLLDQNNFSACLNCAMGAVCKGGAHIEAENGFWMEPDTFLNTATVSAESQREDGLHRGRRDWTSTLPFPVIASISSYMGMDTLRSAARRQGPKADSASNASSRRPRPVIMHRCPAGDS